MTILKKEYAIAIYRIIHNTDDDGDCYINGVYSAVMTLTDREQTVLESRLSYGNTLKKTAEIIGLTNIERVRQIQKKAILKLKHPLRAKRMRVSLIEKECEYYKEKHKAAQDEINLLKSYIVKLEVVEKQGVINDYKIEELDFTVRAFNVLKRAGKKTLCDILRIEDYNEFCKIRNLGKKTFNEIIEKMREHGFNDWVTQIETSRNEATVNIPI